MGTEIILMLSFKHHRLNNQVSQPKTVNQGFHKNNLAIKDLKSRALFYWSCTDGSWHAIKDWFLAAADIHAPIVTRRIVPKTNKTIPSSSNGLTASYLNGFFTSIAFTALSSHFDCSTLPKV
ncbi:hypothetical protein P5673_017903 [Acropora cervicornis]|uniref:Uncharacterized protein n=1 Tax=Acropora cervicornis TaxID=6130 RepID=A0AAD9QDG9_ACRCE|nr:hypothetical protein P5673_017903 [Acropora cervicornis]